jgi:hypothetical protein
MDASMRPIIALHGVSNSILATGIRDLTDQDARTRSRGGAGPSIAWTIGHLCHYKVKVLELLGQPRAMPLRPSSNTRRPPTARTTHHWQTWRPASQR